MACLCVLQDLGHSKALIKFNWELQEVLSWTEGSGRHFVTGAGPGQLRKDSHSSESCWYFVVGPAQNVKQYMIIFWSMCWSFHFLNLKYTALQFRQEKQTSTHKSGLPCLSVKCKQSTHPQTNTHHNPQPLRAALLSILNSAGTYRCYQLLLFCH